jgi:hypothetical protein
MQSEIGHLQEIAAPALPTVTVKGVAGAAPDPAAVVPAGDGAGLPMVPSIIATEPAQATPAAPVVGESPRAATRRVSPDR